MERAILQFRQRISETKPWITVAIIAAVGLLVFFVAQGAVYWQASGSNSSLRSEIDILEKSIDQFPSGLEEQEARLEVDNFRLETLRSLFDYPATDTLMSIVSDTADAAGLDLISMTADESGIEQRGSLLYRVRPISVVMDGPTASVQLFLSLIYDRVPVVAVSGFRIIDLNVDPSVQLQLRFFLSPELVPEEAEETAG